MADLSTARGRIVPSKPDYWVGHPANDGSGFTVEQLHALIKDGDQFEAARLRYDLPDRYKVRIMFEPRSVSSIPETRFFSCPVVSCSKDRTRICVLANNGMPYWTDWVQR